MDPIVMDCWFYMDDDARVVRYFNIHHFFPFTAGFFAPFWAALSAAFGTPWTLPVTFLSALFLSINTFFLSFISRMAYWANAFLSYGLAVFIFLMASRVTPSMALSLLKTLFFFFFPASSFWVFLLSLLQAVVHLNFWALIFLHNHDMNLNANILDLLKRKMEFLPSLSMNRCPWPG